MPLLGAAMCLMFGHLWDSGKRGWFTTPKTHRDKRQVFRGTLFVCGRCGGERFEWAPPPR
jgi:hypothetical protein